MAKRKTKVPRSMVLRLGSNMKNHSLSQLVRDMRNVMQPHTAIRLKERKSNKLRDFVVMAGPLNVSHLMVFSQSDAGTTQLRIARMSRGPTISFKVENYSLCKDVRKILKRPKSITKESKEYLNPPLLVLNGFTNPQTAEPHEKLLITTFQNMFPPIQPHLTKLSSVKRVLMIHKDSETGAIDLRHYTIETKAVEGSKNVKKLISAKKSMTKKLPNLSRASDVSELLTDPYSVGGFTSDSEVEEDSIVDMKSEPVVSKKKEDATADEESSNVKKRAIKLTEIGPRLRLHLTKIEDGVASGKVLYHKDIKKSKKEIAELEKKHQEKQKLKDARKQEQAENIAKKKAKKDAKKERRKAREEERQKRLEAGENVSEDEESDDEESEDEDMDDEEIPEDLDSDLYSDVDDAMSESDDDAADQ
ncbi:Ribosome biogenesis protein SSF2 [Cyberlindnera fabianii]|uniref:Ribosome biogenesis protein SSF2 n=1 Tax=Cyberlindnera fabianii TaxID=36022 RepID=A0A1V2KZM5_CYBFA|nr:Ribosome biogenesis protein SSF2 [Cyberlindnera fabianii]